MSLRCFELLRDWWRARGQGFTVPRTGAGQSDDDAPAQPGMSYRSRPGESRQARLSATLRRDALADFPPGQLRMTGPVELARHMGLTGWSGEQPSLWPRHAVAQKLERGGGERRVAIPAALACSTRSIMRLLSMSDTFSATTSDTRRPAP